MTIITLHHIFSPSLFKNVGVCFETHYFSEGAELPQKSTSAQNKHLVFFNNNLKKGGVQLLLSNYIPHIIYTYLPQILDF